MVKVTLKDGSVREYEDNVTLLEVAKSLSQKPVSYTHLTLPTIA